MSEIRIILGEMPCLLTEIISDALISKQNISVIGNAKSEHELIELCTGNRPDLVILGCSDSDAEAIGRELLLQCPNVKVVALTESGRSSVVYELRPHRVEIGELSATELTGLIIRLIEKDEGAVL